ncbi:TetR/AcrR family transcriptional regulator [Rhodopirellula sallentina]|uniref:Transcriptional regulator, TetR-like, DNA-binding, bacterial/archaeal domain protein n=1 Tax=Rhodopirellula sallentina SM41 TaxID=1263870 RepID=M5U8R1_9BACT|nr:TetR/AcrR family transcriptional regulator [Rhodopirellula sallentina]EMI57825.1 Transcriptional regulator, TetR-like, DNA-binding, bacterial/archaeal domain protein [Rhodopirellula sallentina SM41]
MVNKKKTWKRARKPEQKAERIDAILEAAGVLLDEQGLEGTGLNAIARQAGLSKPNLYVYFESREAILLRLLLKESVAWAKSFKRRLDQIERVGDVDAVADAFAASLARRRRFCTLSASLASVFEHNVGPETIAQFKREFLTIVQPCVSALSEALPDLSDEESSRAMAMLVMSATGMWAHCHPSESVQIVYKQPEFEHIKFDFKETVSELAGCFLQGILTRT